MGKKLEVELNAEKILIKKVQNVLKCQKKKLLRYHSKFFEHGSQCRVVFLPGALEVAQGVPWVNQGVPRVAQGVRLHLHLLFHLHHVVLFAKHAILQILTYSANVTAEVHH